MDMMTPAPAGAASGARNRSSVTEAGHAGRDGRDPPEAPSTKIPPLTACTQSWLTSDYWQHSLRALSASTLCPCTAVHFAGGVAAATTWAVTVAAACGTSSCCLRRRARSRLPLPVSLRPCCRRPGARRQSSGCEAVTVTLRVGLSLVGSVASVDSSATATCSAGGRQRDTFQWDSGCRTAVQTQPEAEAAAKPDGTRRHGRRLRVGHAANRTACHGAASAVPSLPLPRPSATTAAQRLTGRLPPGLAAAASGRLRRSERDCQCRFTVTGSSCCVTVGQPMHSAAAQAVSLRLPPPSEPEGAGDGPGNCKFKLFKLKLSVRGAASRRLEGCQSPSRCRTLLRL